MLNHESKPIISAINYLIILTNVKTWRIVKTLVPNKKHHKDISLNSSISMNDFNNFFTKIGKATYEHVAVSASQQNTGTNSPPPPIFSDHNQ